jgi:hypothetical protein
MDIFVNPAAPIARSRYAEAMFDHARHDSHPRGGCILTINSQEGAPGRENGLQPRAQSSFEEITARVGAKFGRPNILSIPVLSNPLRSKSSTSSLTANKVADKLPSATKPRSLIPKWSTLGPKSAIVRSSIVTTQVSDPSSPGRAPQPSLQTHSARTSLNLPTRNSGLSPKSSDPKQTIRHRRSTVTIPKAPVLHTQLRAERHRSPEDEQVKKYTMTRHSLDQLQAQELDQARRSLDSNIATAVIELQGLPQTYRTPLASPIRSEGSCSTFVTASEGVESKDECEMDFDPCEVGQGPWTRDGPAPFVSTQVGQVGSLSNGKSASPVLRVPRGRDRVHSCDRIAKSAYTNGTYAHQGSSNTSDLYCHMPNVANLPSTSSRSSHRIKAAIGPSDVIAQASISGGANRSRPTVVGHPRLRLIRP